MTLDELISNYILGLKKEFVENRSFWNSSLSVVNDTIVEMNSRFGSKIKQVVYNDFCTCAEVLAEPFLRQLELEEFLMIKQTEVLNLSPELSKMKGEQFDSAYLLTAKSLQETKIKSLQRQFHRHCMEKCLESKAPDEFHKYKIVLDSLWKIEVDTFTQQ